MSPKVSVIIPTYNRVATLPRAVDSVLSQSFSDFELLIVDDGSTDGTAEYLNKVSQSPRVTVLTQANAGVSSARNQGIGHAKGEWIAFLDSDDQWLEDKLKQQILLSQNFDLIHGEELWIRNGQKVNAMRKHKKSGGDVFAQAVKLCCISPSTALLKKSLFEEVGLFREDFPVCEDYDLWLRITAFYQVGFVETPIIRKFGGHSDQLSRRFFAMDYWRILSLDNIIKNRALSLKNRQCARAELFNKCRILLNGYRKHGNLADFDQIFKIYRCHHSC